MLATEFQSALWSILEGTVSPPPPTLTNSTLPILQVLYSLRSLQVSFSHLLSKQGVCALGALVIEVTGCGQPEA